MTDAQTEVRAIPEFIRPWTAPFHVTMDGIKDAKGCWVCSAANNKLAHQLVELMDYAATAATALATKNTELSDLQILLVSARQRAERAEAHLAEARKVLEAIYTEARSLPAHTSAVTREYVLTSKLAVIRDAVRRVLTGGKNNHAK